MDTLLIGVLVKNTGEEYLCVLATRLAKNENNSFSFAGEDAYAEKV